MAGVLNSVKMGGHYAHLEAYRRKVDENYIVTTNQGFKDGHNISQFNTH